MKIKIKDMIPIDRTYFQSNLVRTRCRKLHRDTINILRLLCNHAAIKDEKWVLGWNGRDGREEEFISFYTYPSCRYQDGFFRNNVILKYLTDGKSYDYYHFNIYDQKTCKDVDIQTDDLNVIIEFIQNKLGQIQ